MFRRREASRTNRKVERPEGVEPENEPFTYIQTGTVIKGLLTASGRVRVHGVVQGDVRISGTLEVAGGGVVEGETIEAKEVKILGRVKVSRLAATGKVELWRGGELVGDVTASTLDIEEGARFNGRSEMLSDAEPSEAVEPAAPAHGEESPS